MPLFHSFLFFTMMQLLLAILRKASECGLIESAFRPSETKALPFIPEPSPGADGIAALVIHRPILLVLCMCILESVHENKCGHALPHELTNVALHCHMTTIVVTRCHMRIDVAMHWHSKANVAMPCHLRANVALPHVS